MEYREATWVKLHESEMNFLIGEDLNGCDTIDNQGCDCCEPAIIEKLECAIESGAIHIRATVNGAIADEWTHSGGFTLRWATVGGRAA